EPARHLVGTEQVSMNLWGFRRRMFDHLAEALAAFDPAHSARPELLLPDVVNTLVEGGRDRVRVVQTSARCIGVTHQEDLPLVRREVAAELERRAVAARRV
ncbi:MAG: nucleotidyltransferase, partial [Acidimicrobiaceae bacterium]|nr:nucleotidyltransferase [Acidimicrobiaceae bacterium]